MFSAPAPLASHFTLPSRACTDGPGNTSQATTKDPSYPEAYWKDSQGGCTQSSQGSLVVQKCLTSVLFNYNTGQGPSQETPVGPMSPPPSSQTSQSSDVHSVHRPSELSSWWAGKVRLMLMPHSCICAHTDTGTCHTYMHTQHMYKYGRVCAYVYTHMHMCLNVHLYMNNTHKHIY